MPDDVRTHIDKIYDTADRIVDSVASVFGVDVHASPGKLSGGKVKVALASSDRAAIAAPPAAKRVLLLPAAPEPFRISETVADRGTSTFTVTNGIVTSPPLPSRAYAEQVLDSIMASAKVMTSGAATATGKDPK